SGRGQHQEVNRAAAILLKELPQADKTECDQPSRQPEKEHIGKVAECILILFEAGVLFREASPLMQADEKGKSDREDPEDEDNQSRRCEEEIGSQVFTQDLTASGVKYVFQSNHHYYLTLIYGAYS